MNTGPSKCSCASFTNTHGDLIRHVDQLCPQHGRRATEPDIGRLLAIEAAAREVVERITVRLDAEDAAAIEALRLALGEGK